jgi:prevent-host-death family protein
MRSITAQEANQTFARLLEEAEAGQSLVITRSGKPVAMLSPYPVPHPHDHEAAIERIVALMREGLALGGRHFSRDEMHER